MRILEMFAGTGSVGKIFGGEKGHEVISLDMDAKAGATITANIMEWDYTVFPPGHFDFIWASPPCCTFSTLRRCNIGRACCKITREDIERDIAQIGVPILRRTQAIIAYFAPPKGWIIENPWTGKMKEYISDPMKRVAYCRYGFPYRKWTALWSNRDLSTLLDCDHGRARHEVALGVRHRVSRSEMYRIPPDLVRAVHDIVSA